jgi:hypothetical protein
MENIYYITHNDSYFMEKSREERIPKGGRHMKNQNVTEKKYLIPYIDAPIT